LTRVKMQELGTNRCVYTFLLHLMASLYKQNINKCKDGRSLYIWQY
jgi:hypothetical protein